MFSAVKAAPRSSCNSRAIARFSSSRVVSRWPINSLTSKVRAATSSSSCVSCAFSASSMCLRSVMSVLIPTSPIIWPLASSHGALVDNIVRVLRSYRVVASKVMALPFEITLKSSSFTRSASLFSKYKSSLRKPITCPRCFPSKRSLAGLAKIMLPLRSFTKIASGVLSLTARNNALLSASAASPI